MDDVVGPIVMVEDDYVPLAELVKTAEQEGLVVLPVLVGERRSDLARAFQIERDSKRLSCMDPEFIETSSNSGIVDSDLRKLGDVLRSRRVTILVTDLQMGHNFAGGQIALFLNSVLPNLHTYFLSNKLEYITLEDIISISPDGRTLPAITAQVFLKNDQKPKELFRIIRSQIATQRIAVRRWAWYLTPQDIDRWDEKLKFGGSPFFTDFHHWWELAADYAAYSQHLARLARLSMPVFGEHTMSLADAFYYAEGLLFPAGQETYNPELAFQIEDAAHDLFGRCRVDHLLDAVDEACHDFGIAFDWPRQGTDSWRVERCGIQALLGIIRILLQEATKHGVAGTQRVGFSLDVAASSGIAARRLELLVWVENATSDVACALAGMQSPVRGLVVCKDAIDEHSGRVSLEASSSGNMVRQTLRILLQERVGRHIVNGREHRDAGSRCGR